MALKKVCLKKKFPLKRKSLLLLIPLTAVYISSVTDNKVVPTKTRFDDKNLENRRQKYILLEVALGV